MDTEAVVEATTDIVETIAEHADAVEVIVKNNPAVVAGVLVAGLAAGAALSYLVTKKYLSVKFEHLLEDELDKTAKYYDERYSVVDTIKAETERIEEETEKVVKATKLVEEASKIATKAGYTSYHKIANDEIVVVEEVEVPDFDYEAEERKRKRHQPYIIDHDTYMENDAENTQTTLTYYDEDEVFADDEDEAMISPFEVLGHDNLKFGYGSNDPKTVYIRNERLDTDFEVVLAQGKYTELVLGLHEENAPPLKNRNRNR